MSCNTTCIAPSPSNAHCAAECHRTFGAVSAFDRHRRGGECLDPARLAMHTDDRGVWRYDVAPGSGWHGDSAPNRAPQRPEPVELVGRDTSGTSEPAQTQWRWDSDGLGGWLSA